MKLLIATILLFWTQSMFAQLPADIKTNLVKKDLFEFKKFAETLSENRDRIKTYWEVERDLTKGFQERIWIAEKSVPYEKDSYLFSVYRFRLNLITAGKRIIYYDLQEQKSKKVNNEWVEFYGTIEKYKNDTLYQALEDNFLKSFGAKLNSADLFIDSIVFGPGCGIGEYDGDDPVEEAKQANPKENYKLNKYIKSKNKIAILNLVQSTNTERQLYGVKGLLELQKTGLMLTQQEIRFIKNVLSKRGNVRTCSGCIYDHREISEIAKELYK